MGEIERGRRSSELEGDGVRRADEAGRRRRAGRIAWTALACTAASGTALVSAAGASRGPTTCALAASVALLIVATARSLDGPLSVAPRLRGSHGSSDAFAFVTLWLTCFAIVAVVLAAAEAAGPLAGLLADAHRRDPRGGTPACPAPPSGVSAAMQRTKVEGAEPAC